MKSSEKKQIENDTLKNCDSGISEEICYDFDILDNIDNIYFKEDFTPCYELEVKMFNFSEVGNLKL